VPGPCLADPHNFAPRRLRWSIVNHDFDELPTPQPEAAPKSEPLLRLIDNETRERCLLSSGIDDEAGALVRGDPLGSAACGDRNAGH
jgi:hypothetical protein